MNTLTLTRLTAALLLAAALTFAPAARADMADNSEGSGKASTDPFRPLIQEPEPKKEIVIGGGDIIPPPRTPPPPPAVEFTVSALAVDGANRVAVIEFQGQTYIVQEGMRIPDTGTPAMEIRTVTDEKVVVQDTRLSKLVSKQLVTQ